jgi:hypothetical protein
LDLVELKYEAFISKVEKYDKPNLLVAAKVAVVVESNSLLESANYSSVGREKKFDRSREYEPNRKCYSCGSDKHLLRECPSRQEYFDRRQEADQHYAEVSHRRSASQSESPKLKSILRRKSGDNGSSKAKHAKHFVNADGEDYNSD